jgi:hypothetical protein
VICSRLIVKDIVYASSEEKNDLMMVLELMAVKQFVKAILDIVKLTWSIVSKITNMEIFRQHAS